MGIKVNLSKDQLSKAGGNGGKYITTSGIYDVTINAVTADVNEHGAITLGLFVTHNDQPQMLYGALPLATFDNKNTIDSSHKALAALCAIADIDIETDFSEVEGQLPIGKAGAMKDVTILEDFEDIEAKIWVKQRYYKKKDGSIGEQRTVQAIYRPEDNASIDEMIGDEPNPAGTSYAKAEKYFTDVAYKDVTEEEVKAMIDERSSGSAPAAPKAAPRKSKFAK